MEIIDSGYKREKPYTTEELADMRKEREALRHWLYEASWSCECSTCAHYRGFNLKTLSGDDI